MGWSVLLLFCFVCEEPVEVRKGQRAWLVSSGASWAVESRCGALIAGCGGAAITGVRGCKLYITGETNFMYGSYCTMVLVSNSTI